MSKCVNVLILCIALFAVACANSRPVTPQEPMLGFDGQPLQPGDASLGADAVASTAEEEPLAFTAEEESESTSDVNDVEPELSPLALGDTAVVRVASQHERGTDLSLVDLDTGESADLTGHPEALSVNHVALSPAGTKLAIVTRFWSIPLQTGFGKIEIINLDATKRREVAQVGPYVDSLAWSRDGSEVYYSDFVMGSDTGNSVGLVVAVDLATLEQTVVAESETGSQVSVLGVNNLGVVYHERKNGAAIYAVVEPDTGRVVDRLEVGMAHWSPRLGGMGDIIVTDFAPDEAGEGGLAVIEGVNSGSMRLRVLAPLPDSGPGVAASPDGLKLAYSETSPPGLNGLLVVELDNPDQPYKLQLPEGEVSLLRWRHDSESLLVGVDNREAEEYGLYLVALDGTVHPVGMGGNPLALGSASVDLPNEPAELPNYWTEIIDAAPPAEPAFSVEGLAVNEADWCQGSYDLRQGSGSADPTEDAAAMRDYAELNASFDSPAHLADAFAQLVQFGNVAAGRIEADNITYSQFLAQFDSIEDAYVAMDLHDLPNAISVTSAYYFAICYQ